MDRRLDFAFKIFVNEFAITVSALDPALVGRNLQPDARMPQSAFAAVTGHSICVDDAGFGCIHSHIRPFKRGSSVCAVMANAGPAGKGLLVFVILNYVLVSRKLVEGW